VERFLTGNQVGGWGTGFHRISEKSFEKVTG